MQNAGSATRWGRSIVAAGANHTIGIASNGTTLSTGANFDGECNVSEWNGLHSVSASPVHLARNTGKSHTLGLQTDGTVQAVGWNHAGQCNVDEWMSMVSVAAGWRFSIGTDNEGNVRVAGRFESDSLHYWREVIEVAAGDWHVVSRRADGRALAAGNNSRGQCNVSDWRDLQSVSAGYLHSIGLMSDGHVICAGMKAHWDGCEQWENVVSVSAGAYHSVGLTSEGTVVAAGSNDYGQCDVRSWQRIVAVVAGSAFTVGVKDDGRVIGTGDNRHGQLNLDSWQIDIARNRFGPMRP